MWTEPDSSLQMWSAKSVSMCVSGVGWIQLYENVKRGCVPFQMCLLCPQISQLFPAWLMFVPRWGQEEIYLRFKLFFLSNSAGIVGFIELSETILFQGNNLSVICPLSSHECWKNHKCLTAGNWCIMIVFSNLLSNNV